MKRAVIALILFSLLFIGVLVNGYFLDKTITKSKAEIREMQLYSHTSPRLAVYDCLLAEENWNKRERYLMLFIDRNETAAISVLYAQMVAAAKYESKGEFEMCRASLETALSQLENISRIRWQYLF